MQNHRKIMNLIIVLQDRGYDKDFVIQNEGILCIQENILIAPEEFEVIETHCFENNSRQADKMIIYVISVANSDMKGILMTTYRTYSRGLSIHLWSKLAVNMIMSLTEIRDNQPSRLSFN